MKRSNNSARKISYLSALVNKEIRSRGDSRNLIENAARAFFNLAKRLAYGGNKHRLASRKSLAQSLKNYDRAGDEIVPEGLTSDDLYEFLNNPDSKISIRNLRFRKK